MAAVRPWRDQAINTDWSMQPFSFWWGGIGILRCAVVGVRLRPKAVKRDVSAPLNFLRLGAAPRALAGDLQGASDVYKMVFEEMV